jgi:tRNA threonylcarbamoyladenosine biosynthesis protein TsaB
MKNILALDTSTDACSVAWRCGNEVSNRFQLIPRQHNHRLFEMLGELFPDGAVNAHIHMLAYGQGPGSFTGLRIAASAVQGLGYALGVPVAGISTLACLAQGALRRGVVAEGEHVLALLDARINEVYWGLYRFEQGLAVACVEDQVSAPGDLPADLLKQPAVAMGSGLSYLESLPAELREAISRSVADQWPDSVDLLPLADREAAQGATLEAAAVQPVYLRNEIHWKKISEQGPARG